MKLTLLKFCLAVALTLSVTALAADENAAKTEKPAAEKTEKKAKADANPYRSEISAMARDLAKAYNREQASALAQIRNGFGMTRAVHLVRKDVSHAADLCSRENPDMKGEMTARFDSWSASVDPLLKKNQEDMETAIKAAAFPDEKKMRAYLDLIDKAAEYADSKIEKNAVTSPEACNGLLKSMDETEPTMVGLLQGIVWTPAAPSSGEDGDSKE